MEVSQLSHFYLKLCIFVFSPQPYHNLTLQSVFKNNTRISRVLDSHTSYPQLTGSHPRNMMMAELTVLRSQVSYRAGSCHEKYATKLRQKLTCIC